MNDNSFITMLYAMRRDRNLSQKSMASLLGISPQYYNDLESGRRMPSVKIADAVSAVNRKIGLMPGQTERKCKHGWHWRAAKAHGWKLGPLLFMAILILPSPVWAAEQVIQFSVSDWKKALHKIELDQQETKLLRQQNADLKQLITLSTEQATQCEQMNKASQELEQASDEYRRSLEAENDSLRATVRLNNWIMGGQAVVIFGLMAWAFW